MSNEIVVLHYQEGSSDKIWAINKVLNADKTHDVWYGRRGTRLSHSKLANISWQKRMRQKLDKGYREVENITIDVENNVAVPFLQETEEIDEIPTSLWYRVSNQVPVNLIRDYLNITIHLLSEKHELEVQRLKELPIFEALYEGKKSGGAEYEEGPLAVLLLFGLRRYLNDFAGPPASVDLVQIADDSNNMLPDRFDNLGDYIEKTCIALFNKNGWFNGDDNLHDSEESLILELAEKHELRHYTSVTAIKQLAIAMGCIDAPIDLTVIRSETKAAFF